MLRPRRVQVSLLATLRFHFHFVHEPDGTNGSSSITAKFPRVLSVKTAVFDATLLGVRGWQATGLGGRWGTFSAQETSLCCRLG